MRIIHDEETIKYDEVKVGEWVDQGAGCFLERVTDTEWVQWDGGWDLEVPEADVKEWLS